MALNAGIVSITLEYAQDLKDADWFGKQDPYAILTCGNQTFRSRTAIDGGRNPVWHETFKFNIINDNSIDIKLWDEDTLKRDDFLGQCTVSLAKVRATGSDRITTAVMSKKSGKQRGNITLSLSFQPNSALQAPQAPHGYAPPYQLYTPAPGYAPYPTAPVPYQPYAPPAPYLVQPGYAPAPFGAQPPQLAQAPSQHFHGAPPPQITPAPSQHFYGQQPPQPPAPSQGVYPAVPTYYPTPAAFGQHPSGRTA